MAVFIMDYTREQIQDRWKKSLKNKRFVHILNTIAPFFIYPENVKFVVDKINGEIMVGATNLNMTGQNLDDSDYTIIKNLIWAWERAVLTPAYPKRIQNKIKYSLNVVLTDGPTKEKKDINEVALKVFKRDPKSGKPKIAYRCIGGRRHGRKVHDPADCMSVPDIQKKIQMKQNKRFRAAKMALGRKKTADHDLRYKRTRMANKRLKMARGI